MPKISIIVPVYGVEKYLDKCVKSILNQTFKDFELILVDDGSPDNCGAMCDVYATEDERVIVIHKENGGLSAARNAGLDVAKGRFIGFVDSDDYIENDMYELLYDNIQKEEADLSIVGIFDLYAGKTPVIKEQKYIVTDMLGAMKIILEGKLVSVNAYNKLYKREIFEEVRYPVGMITEDAAIILNVLEKTKKIVIDTRQKYYYYHRANSISSNHYSKKDLDTIKAWEDNETHILKKYPDLAYVAHTRVCWAYFTVLDKLMKSQVEYEDKKIQEKIVKFLRENFSFVMKNIYFTRNRKISALALKFSVPLYRKISVLEENHRKIKNE